MIRKAKLEDLEDILNIYHYAREYMKKNGNSTQWGNIHPAQSLIEEDIKKGISYVLYDDEGLYGVFALIYGKDPTYQKIYEGKWLDDTLYATIHRIASNGRKMGVFKEGIDFSKEIYNHLRIDTHENNKVMQHSILKAGFKYCGNIITSDNTPRLAYEYIK